MGYPHYTPTGHPRQDRAASSTLIRKEFEKIEAGIDAMNRFVLSVYIPDTTGTPKTFIAVPWDCHVTRMTFVAVDAIEASFSFWVRLANGVSSDYIFWVDESQSGVFGNAGYPAGSTEAFVVDTSVNDNYIFSAGDVIQIDGAQGGTAVGRLMMAIEVART